MNSLIKVVDIDSGYKNMSKVLINKDLLISLLSKEETYVSETKFKSILYHSNMLHKRGEIDALIIIKENGNTRRDI